MPFWACFSLVLYTDLSDVFHPGLKGIKGTQGPRIDGPKGNKGERGT